MIQNQLKLIPPSSYPSYHTVVLDPPWNEQGGGKSKRGADRHYPVMKTPQILSTIIQGPHWNQLGDNAHMYMWVTNNFLIDGLWLMEALNFRYVTNFVWIKMKDSKLQQGLGQYFRGSHELCLFGTHKKGRSPTAHRTKAKDIVSVLFAERTKHSAKPVNSYEIIERRSQGPYLEIFSRKPRKGWTVWGNEV